MRRIFILMLLLLSAGAHAQAPKQMHYQGFLTSSAGAPVNTPAEVTFRIYGAPSGGSPLWSETHAAVPVANGTFSVLLGTLSPLNLPFNVPYWLGIKVGADAEMAPRQALAAAPYLLGGGQGQLLAVNRSGNGTVTSTPPGISCGASCLASFTAGTMVSLSAVADSFSTFAGWTGACSGTGSCEVSMDGLKSVGATFTQPAYTLNSSRTGPGTVISSPAGVYCGADCFEPYASGTLVSLFPVPDIGASFGSWSGACSGGGSCNVLMDGNKSVSAGFGYLLNVTLVGGTGGTITSSPSGISCPGVCSAVYTTGVTLTQTPGPNATFIGWSGGGCSGTGAECLVSMNQAHSVFAAYTFPLNVTRYNNGGGTVSSEPAGIDCGSTCSQPFVAGTVVSLSGQPDPLAVLLGWTGCDSITPEGACTLTVNGREDVQARFGYPVSVSKVNGSFGDVTGPGGMDCGATCVVNYNYNDPVLLTAKAGPGHSFSSWSGCDSTVGDTCVVVASGARNVSATFD